MSVDDKESVDNVDSFYCQYCRVCDVDSAFGVVMINKMDLVH